MNCASGGGRSRRLGSPFGLGRHFFPLVMAESAFSFFCFVVLSAHKSLYIASMFRFGVATMLIRRTLINLNLLLALGIGLAGCGTTSDGDSKVQAVIRLHMETTADGSVQSGAVPIYRTKPIMVNVQSIPFLTEAYLTGASVVDVPGGFAIQLKFDRSGDNLLEEYTGLNRGKHFAIFCQFGPKKQMQNRWLAAPLINRTYQGGVIVFTPDCTREEADKIVLGLNNAVAEAKKQRLIK